MARTKATASKKKLTSLTPTPRTLLQKAKVKTQQVSPIKKQTAVRAVGKLSQTAKTSTKVTKTVAKTAPTKETKVGASPRPKRGPSSNGVKTSQKLKALKKSTAGIKKMR